VTEAGKRAASIRTQAITLKSLGSNYIPTLDGWRAIAILLVIFEHASFRTFRPVGWTELGAHGVEIFFVLSGFLITGKLLEDRSLSRFYTRRVFRILPILFAYITAICVIAFAVRRIPLSGSEVTASLFFVRNYCSFAGMNVTGAGWFTSHLWSLSIEEQFYLIWPLVLLRLGKDSLLGRILSATLLFAIWCAIFVLVQVGRIQHLGGWHWLPNLHYGGLIVGCVLRIAFSHAHAKAALSKILAGRSLAVVASLCVYLAMFHARITIFDPLICGLGVCATMVEPNALVGRLLECSLFRWIGRLSYSLYIWQQLFLGFGVVYRPFGSLSRFPLNIAATVAVACLSYYLLERPMMRWGHELTARRSPSQPTLPSPVLARSSV
jgi:peptidoglycan/LPS O-acetylase OafA/YrhL